MCFEGHGKKEKKNQVLLYLHVWMLKCIKCSSSCMYVRGNRQREQIPSMLHDFFFFSLFLSPAHTHNKYVGKMESVFWKYCEVYWHKRITRCFSRCAQQSLGII